MPLRRIVSGGQSGVDRAALDVAINMGIPCGGWCPRGRLAEDGPITKHYPLKETPSIQNRVRTEWNIRDSDATLILNIGKLEGGTALTKVLATRLGRPCLVVDLEAKPEVKQVVDWLELNHIATLNVAGPRGSKRPELYQYALKYLLLLIQEVGFAPDIHPS